MKTIKPETLVPMDLFAEDFPIRIDLAYARDDNLLFGQKIYRPDARLWLHEDLAKPVLLAAQICHEHHNTRLVLYDGLRTVEAQRAMLETQRVRDNPQWLEEPRLLSPPGAGAHPRGMAIDLSMETEDGGLLDMGTPFDYLAGDPGPAYNPAHRNYTGAAYPASIVKNRRILDEAMIAAAKRLKTEIFPLPQEWWDFRRPAHVYEGYVPLSDSDLPPQMRMADTPGENAPPDLPPGHFGDLRRRIIDQIKSV